MSLLSKNVKELKDMARGKIKGFSTMRRAELIKALSGKKVKKVVKSEPKEAPKKRRKMVVKSKKTETLTPTQLKNLKKYYGKINPNRQFSKSLSAGNILRKRVLSGEKEYHPDSH